MAGDWCTDLVLGLMAGKKMCVNSKIVSYKPNETREVRNITEDANGLKISLIPKYSTMK